MSANEAKVNLVDHYYSILKNLSSNEKLDLIARLSKSMKIKVKEKKDDSWKSLFGALELDETADEFIEGIKKDRNFNREEIDL